MADPRIRAALDRLALAAGTYLEEAAKGALRDPAIEGAVDVAVDIVDDWLRTADAASSAARHAGAAAVDPKEARAAARALEQTAEEIESRLGIDAAARDRAAAREELR